MLFTVLDYRTKSCVGSYQADRVAYTYPYHDIENQKHHEVEAGKLPEGYYLDENLSVLYNFSYESPVSPPLVVAELATELRHEQGFALYRRIAADLALSGTLSMIDVTIAAYPSTLLAMRCFLKDGMGETALRYLVKHLAPTGMFSVEKLALYEAWLLEYCMEFMPEGYTIAEYEQRLIDVREAVSI